MKYPKINFRNPKYHGLFSLVLFVLLLLKLNEYYLPLTNNNTVQFPKVDNLSLFDNLWRPEIVESSSSDRIFEQFKWTQLLVNSSFLKSAKPKKILVFDGLSMYYGTKGKVRCPFESSALERKCEIYEDRIGYGFEQMYEDYDAVVSLRHWDYKLYEPKVPASRFHFLYILECPYVAKYADLARNNAILASYWRGSDITLPYYKWQPDDSSVQFYSDKHKKLDNNPKPEKTRLAAIIVSNCNAKNNRLKYVKELQKYVQVDIYGKCGPLSCKTGPPGNERDLCDEVIKKYYKFYLSFEKANCRDYITEKFFHNALLNDAVAVVMGPPRSDYEFASPPNSFIHIEDFQSPKHLADYLIKLDRNDTLYQEYTKWKTKGRIVYVWDSFFCRVCGMLFYSDIKSSRPVWKDQSSWKSVNKCLPVGQWYWRNSSTV